MNTLRKAYRTTALIGLWMMGSVFLCALFVELVAAGRLPITVSRAEGGSEMIRNIFFGVAAAVPVVIRFVNSRLLSSSPASAGRGPGIYGPKIRRLMALSILSFTLSGLVVLLGLVLFILNSSTSDFYLFVLISLAFFAVYFPRFGKWEEWMRDHGPKEKRKGKRKEKRKENR